MTSSRIAILLLALSPLAVPSTASAACPGETQMEMNECEAQEFEKADAALNQAYRQLPRSASLVAAEKAWIAFRDAECKYQAERYEGGSMQPMVYSGCLRSLTEDRIKQLEQSAEDQ